MGKGKGRRVARDPLPQSGLHVRPGPAAPVGSTNHLTPVFDLSQLRGEYCLSACTADQKAAFADRLHLLSRMTWGEIQRAPRHGLGTETIARSALGERQYPPEATEDVPILAFRCFGHGPMIGYRIDRRFVVLILDPNCTAYDHG